MNATTARKIAERTADLKPLEIDWLIIVRQVTEVVQQSPASFETYFESIYEPTKTVLDRLDENGYTYTVEKIDNIYKLTVKW